MGSTAGITKLNLRLWRSFVRGFGRTFSFRTFLCYQLEQIHFLPLPPQCQNWAFRRRKNNLKSDTTGSVTFDSQWSGCREEEPLISAALVTVIVIDCWTSSKMCIALWSQKLRRDVHSQSRETTPLCGYQSKLSASMECLRILAAWSSVGSENRSETFCSQHWLLLRL